MSFIKAPIQANKYTLATYAPMQRIALDACGPFPDDGKGNTHVLLLIDTFTRVVELYPCVDVSAATACDALMDWFGRYGFASEIMSDHGSQFVNSVITELMKLLGTKHSISVAYSKQENAIAERSLKEVQRHLTALVQEVGVHSGWSRYLPLVQRIMLTSTVGSIQVAPAQLLYGNVIDLDRGIFLPSAAITAQSDLSKWAADMLSVQSRLLATAELAQRRRDDEHLSSQPERVTQFDIDSLVLVDYPSGRMGSKPPTKLHTHKRGPMRVTSVAENGHHYTLLNLVTNKSEVVEIHRLSPYHVDTNSPDPVAIAARDYTEHVVEEIISHSGSLHKKSDMDFLVKWKGYDTSHNLWLPWKELRSNAILHAYLRLHGMAKLIPK